MVSLAKKYIHFVATKQLQAAEEWATTVGTGGFVIDRGAWRDYNPTDTVGIEFEFEHDALTFLYHFGGILEQRTSPRTDLGINP
jgi:hypothetical protein